MTSLMEQAIEALRHIPVERQDEIAHVVMQFTGIDQPVYELTPEERVDILEARLEIERGDFATAKEVSAICVKHDI